MLETRIALFSSCECTYRDRPELNRMLDQLRKGEVVTVWKIDRLARSTPNLLETVEMIDNAGARFQSISEPGADTTTHAGKMIMTIFAGIIELERDLIRERTGAGHADVQKRGVRFGRPKKMNGEQQNLAKRLLKESVKLRTPSVSIPPPSIAPSPLLPDRRQSSGMRNIIHGEAMRELCSTGN